MRAFIVLILTGVLYSSVLFAQPDCLCGQNRTVKESLARADVVFSGQVEKIEAAPAEQAGPKHEWAGRKVTLRVAEFWKGRPGMTIDIYTAASTNECGYAFERGQRYLVYADKVTEQGQATGKFSTTRCDRTRPLAGAKDDLRELGRGHKPRS